MEPLGWTGDTERNTFSTPFIAMFRSHKATPRTAPFDQTFARVQEAIAQPASNSTKAKAKTIFLKANRRGDFSATRENRNWVQKRLHAREAAKTHKAIQRAAQWFMENIRNEGDHGYEVLKAATFFLQATNTSKVSTAEYEAQLAVLVKAEDQRNLARAAGNVLARERNEHPHFESNVSSDTDDSMDDIDAILMGRQRPAPAPAPAPASASTPPTARQLAPQPKPSVLKAPSPTSDTGNPTPLQPRARPAWQALTNADIQFVVPDDVETIRNGDSTARRALPAQPQPRPRLR